MTTPKQPEPKAMTKMLKPEELPAPDTVIDYGDGTFGPLMFHYATEADRLNFIAREQGFDYKWVEFGDVVPDYDELAVEYANGADDIISRWIPPVIEGWQLVGKNDSEYGPVAHYLRRSADWNPKP